MIAITRRQVRRLRAVFRRHPLGITHKGALPPLVFRSDADSEVRVRHQQPSLAVEHVLPGSGGREEAIALPLDALADFEGGDNTAVVLEAAAADRTIVTWNDQGIPQRREYAVPDLAGLPPFPTPPAAFESCPGDLLDALAEAAATTDEDSTRYALGCLQWNGATGQVIATDGRQILIQGGFRVPWDGELLVRRTPLFAVRDLPRDRPVLVGRTDTHVVIRAGLYTLWLAIRTDARFPHVEHALPAEQAIATRLRFAPEDARFLGQALDRLPGADVHNAPVTLDLNGKVAARARSEGGDRVTELVLGRSSFTGEPVRVNTNRHLLARAVRLGFDEVRIGSPDEPIVCRDRRRVYLWQPLSAESAIAPSDDAVVIDSVGASSAVGPAEPTRDAVTPDVAVPTSSASVAPTVATQATTDNVVGGSSPGGLAGLIQEAEALHEALADAKTRTQKLIGALRRERKRSRLVQSTLAALGQIRLQEAVA